MSVSSSNYLCLSILCCTKLQFAWKFWMLNRFSEILNVLEYLFPISCTIAEKQHPAILLAENVFTGLLEAFNFLFSFVPNFAYNINDAK